MSANASTKGDFDADVVVVGAGYAGMVAAYRLWQKNHSVIVVEAMERHGGRSYSTNLSDGTFIDIGAGWTGSTEYVILNLVKELGLQMYTQFGLEDQPDPMAKNLYVAPNGDKRLFDGLAFPTGPTAAIEIQVAIATIDAYLSTVPLDAPWTAESAKAWDSISAGVFLDNLLSDPEAKAVCIRNLVSIFALDPHAVSFLHLLWDSRTAGGVDKFGAVKGGSVEYRIVGGTQQIPNKIKELLGDSAFVFNSPVREIQQDDDGVTVVSELRTIRAKKAIVAIPTCMTSTIRFVPQLSADRAQLSQRTPQGSAMKMQLVYDRAFWREDPYDDKGHTLTGNTFAVNKSVVPQTMDAGGPKGVNTPGILACFIDDDDARDMGRLSKEDRLIRIQKELEPRIGSKIWNLSTTISPNYVEFISQDLEWIRGDYASTPGPGVLTASGFGPAMRTPFKNVYWAGVDTATIWYQSIDGAAQSGEKAASDVMAAL